MFLYLPVIFPLLLIPFVFSSGIIFLLLIGFPLLLVGKFTGDDFFQLLHD